MESSTNTQDTDIPEITVVYHDETLLVINKPAGILVIPDGYDPLQPYVRSILQPIWGPLWIIHRLDRYTSGILILARTSQAHQSLSVQFQQRQIKKVYYALVDGIPNWESTTVNLPLRINGDRKHRTVVDYLNGKPAITNLQVEEKYLQHTLIKANPQTGYTHQIRAHLSSIGYPIVADPLYNPSEIKHPGSGIETSLSTPLLSRLALHAFSISFQHPVSNQPCSFTAPYPDDFISAFDFLHKKERS